MKGSSFLVDRAARAALAEVKPPPDLLTEGFPFLPGGWNIVIQPLKPRSMSDGGLEVVEISQNAEEYQITVGRVLRCGPSAFDGKTTSGIELSKFVEGINTAEQLIGKYIFHQLHVGQILRLRKTDQQIKVIKLTDILGVTEDPHAWKFYI